jgi:3-oxoacyl-[acyl-carrier protein] reductase
LSSYAFATPGGQDNNAYGIGSDFQKQAEVQTPLGRIGQPRDVATVATFLASPDSGWITDETFMVSGGYR